MIDLQYSYKMSEILNSNSESVILWINSGWLNEIELIVIYSLLAMSED